MSKTFIIVKFDLEGSHKWPDAPDKYALLRNRHGHIFHFEVRVPVTASRQIEFLDARRELKAAVEATYGYEPCDFYAMSCEDLAEYLIARVRALYDCGAIAKVYEDAFVGAEVRRLDD